MGYSFLYAFSTEPYGSFFMSKNQEVNRMSDSFGLKIGVEGEKEFKKALSEINQNFKVLGSEMKLVSSSLIKTINLSMHSLPGIKSLTRKSTSRKAKSNC